MLGHNFIKVNKVLAFYLIGGLEKVNSVLNWHQSIPGRFQKFRSKQPFYINVGKRADFQEMINDLAEKEVTYISSLSD